MEWIDDPQNPISHQQCLRHASIVGGTHAPLTGTLLWRSRTIDAGVQESVVQVARSSVLCGVHIGDPDPQEPDRRECRWSGRTAIAMLFADDQCTDKILRL